ncbi:hypothetical protein BC936DRAFT_143461 [Jimgerdemannia flammicorona]|uniref:Uncharacterized protein n=1 Tax=Jimgerdemannia flammicorona TaxID=994334 RepID=A0A432ZYX0_9FUNG|nr:hypothetical protein BC936DRAFT_143461 [Jimgerdemannia flammicorona]
MFGRVLELDPISSRGETLLQIVERNILHRHTIAMIGRSGAGKTATVVDLAKKHFVLYVVCSTSDPNFKNMIDEIDMDSPRQVEHRIELEFTARRIFLLLLFNMDPHITPEQYFYEQMNGGIETIARLVRMLRQYNPALVYDVSHDVETQLIKHLGTHALVIALDDAPVVINHISRKFFTLLCSLVSRMQATLVILGTSLSLMDEDHARVSVAGQSDRVNILNFPFCAVDGVEKMLNNTIDLSGCIITQPNLLTGRLGFSANVINFINDADHTIAKQAVLNRAVDLAINHAKSFLMSKVESLLDNYKACEVLCRMILAYKYENCNTAFEYPTEIDFTDKALCSVKGEAGDYSWTMDEPCVVDVVQQILYRHPEYAGMIVDIMSLMNG